MVVYFLIAFITRINYFIWQIESLQLYSFKFIVYDPTLHRKDFTTNRGIGITIRRSHPNFSEY
jgi:hypothetical protein